MRRVQRWRYYCEYCGKSGGSGHHMARHERGCTANKDRRCGMCGRQGVGGLVESLGAGDEAGVDGLRRAANGCPACMLAAIRQSGFQYPPDAESPGNRVPFDYKAAKKDWWARKDKAEMTAGQGEEPY